MKQIGSRHEPKLSRAGLVVDISTREVDPRLFGLGICELPSRVPDALPVESTVVVVKVRGDH
jgi:hypothetical protein